MLISQDAPCFGKILQMCKILPYHLFREVDNYTLDPYGKYRKAIPLIQKLNEWCLLQYLSEQTVNGSIFRKACK